MNGQKPRSDKFERGLKTRRAVLGADYVDTSLEQADEFNWAMQQLTTEWCWDEIWNRPGLERRDRSLLNLGMTAALNRPQEFKLHLRGALNNGLTKDELKEVFLQIGVYCGVPAALDCFRIARDVFKEMDV
ncbi:MULTISPECIES: carboxymuconolactone decarboxylase family protein [Nitratireductor]|uniref:carboxymuconolactone decarboxylase family protein n=1 Tax=Nitratireductor TaxID=245876 RepID=UPI000D0D68C4|nr:MULTISPECIES: carboxymuconolactone decarboxylase family protein [Nitratireductor]PSM16161.1 4-carboxymuconolactone decarboxylase [Nitratireductor sp. StC3]